MKPRLHLSLWFCILTLQIIPAIGAEKDKTLVFGIVPQESSSKLAEQWTPLMGYLTEHLGRTVRFATAPDIPTFEKRVLMGEYDIAYMNPYHYVEFSLTPGYRAIVREAGKQIHGIVVVNESSEFERLTDLDGQNIVFPAPAAFAATILVRAELESLGISYTPRFVSSHESVYLNVQRGFAPAGGGIERTLNSAQKEGLRGVRVLWRSKGFTPHAFAVHPELPESDASKLQNALLNLSSSERGRKLVEKVNLKPLTSANHADWDDVRGLGLNFIRLEGEQ